MLKVFPINPISRHWDIKFRNMEIIEKKEGD
jgi:hypothetical protein